MTKLTILFICGSLEQGKDGVGDYTRRLAGEIIRQEHSASIISLNDKYISTIEQTEQDADGTIIPVLRLPENLSNKERYGRAGSYIQDFNPEWLSLQFVPYAFQKKGLPLGLGKRLAKIGEGRKWHIMFHELWIRYSLLFSKRTIIESFQKYIIKHLFKELSPLKVHTSNPCAGKDLKKMGITAQILPIFSNISVYYSKKETTDDNSIFKVGFFSKFGLTVEIIQYLVNLQKSLVGKNKKLAIILIGGSNEKAVDFENLLYKNLKFDFQVNHTGFLSEREVSKQISLLNMAISYDYRHILNKSGSVSALLLHGIPVAVPNVHPKLGPNYWGKFDDYMIKRFENVLNVNNVTLKNIHIDNNHRKLFDVAAIAINFINDLNDIKNA